MKRKSFISLILLQIMCVIVFVGCGKSTVITRLERYNINTKLLENYEIVCDIKGETFTGRAPSYAVITFQDEPVGFINSFSKGNTNGFSSEKNDDLKNLIDTYSSLEIPNDFYPNWEDDYKWLCVDEFDGLYLIYFPNEFKLVIFEAGH